MALVATLQQREKGKYDVRPVATPTSNNTSSLIGHTTKKN
jgi:hypothetical protein